MVGRYTLFSLGVVLGSVFYMTAQQDFASIQLSSVIICMVERNSLCIERYESDVFNQNIIPLLKKDREKKLLLELDMRDSGLTIKEIYWSKQAAYCLTIETCTHGTIENYYLYLPVLFNLKNDNCTINGSCINGMVESLKKDSEFNVPGESPWLSSASVATNLTSPCMMLFNRRIKSICYMLIYNEFTTQFAHNHKKLTLDGAVAQAILSKEFPVAALGALIEEAVEEVVEHLVEGVVEGVVQGTLQGIESAIEETLATDNQKPQHDSLLSSITQNLYAQFIALQNFFGKILAKN